jgi:hypothetical protein
LIDVEAVHALLGAIPPRLEAAIRLLHDEGTLRDPRDRKGLFPLLVPLATDDEGRAVGLLRWPTPGNAPFPVVRQEGHGLVRIAHSAQAYAHERLVVADTTGTWEDFHDQACAGLYARGDLHRSGMALPLYLLHKVGMTDAMFERFVATHLARGDRDAALVTADRALREAEGWARPHLVRARLLRDLGQDPGEAARMALLEPLWTLGEPAFAEVASLAGIPGPHDGSSHRRLAADARLPVLDRAAHRLDAAFIDGEDWDLVRQDLAGYYAAAGLGAVAALVR